MGLAEELYKNGIDFNKLPHDCPARASQRLSKFFYNDDGKFSESYTLIDYNTDLRIVLGDPMKAVTFDKEYFAKK